MGVWEYFTEEQQEKMSKQMEQFAPEELIRFRKESNELIGRLRAELPVDGAEVVLLAKRLKDLSNLFAEPDPEVDRAIERFYMENPGKQQHGMDFQLYQYIEKAKSYS